LDATTMVLKCHEIFGWYIRKLQYFRTVVFWTFNHYTLDLFSMSLVSKTKVSWY
jgi:hypothetical protein